jgi:hypothetical protein
MIFFTGDAVTLAIPVTQALRYQAPIGTATLVLSFPAFHSVGEVKGFEYTWELVTLMGLRYVV